MRRERPDDSESSRRSRLAQFGLSFDKQDTTIANLSGGERARLLLNLVAMAAPHLLILDEPTNHLDIDSRRALLDALNDYEGAVILITHDRSLIELVADRLWLTADGHIKPFAGDMEDYARFVLDRAKAGRAPSQSARAASEMRAPPKPEPCRGEEEAAPRRPRVSAAVRRPKQRRRAAAIAWGRGGMPANPQLVAPAGRQPYISRPISHADLGLKAVRCPAIPAGLTVRGGSTGERSCRCQTSACVSFWKLASTSAIRPIVGIRRWPSTSSAPATTSTSST